MASDKKQYAEVFVIAMARSIFRKCSVISTEQIAGAAIIHCFIYQLFMRFSIEILQVLSVHHRPVFFNKLYERSE